MRAINPIDKIREARELKNICHDLRAKGQRIVFTNGCFDLLHVGHVRYLKEAAKLGDVLIVAVNSDRSVNRIKGPSRPLLGEAERAEVVSALGFVDYVTIFDTPDPLPLIEMLEPDVLVKGADWPLDRIVGADAVRGRGGDVARIDLTPQISTTIIIERIMKRFCG